MSSADTTRENSTGVFWIFNGPYNAIGGAARRFRAEVEHFTSRNVQIEVCCRSSVQIGHTTTSRLVFPTRLLPLYVLEVFARAVVSIVRRQRTVFIAHDPISSLGVSLARTFFGDRTRSFLVVHGPMTLEQKWLTKRFFSRVIIETILSMIERAVYRLADRLFAVSEYEVMYLRTRFNTVEKVRLIRNGIEVQKFVRPRNEEMRWKIGVGDRNIMIANVGHLYTYRGLSTLFEGLRLARTSTPSGPYLKLVVVGKGSKTSTTRYMHEVEALGIRDAVVFLGDRRDIPEILAASDIYAERFSNQVDGVGIAIMEAMAAGLPVITGSDWITSILLKNGHDCILVEKENGSEIAKAIVQLIQSPGTGKRMGSAARATARRVFSVDTMLSHCELEYVHAPFI